MFPFTAISIHNIMGHCSKKKNVEIQSPLVTVHLGTMTGCTGGENLVMGRLWGNLSGEFREHIPGWHMHADNVHATLTTKALQRTAVWGSIHGNFLCGTTHKTTQHEKGWVSRATYHRQGMDPLDP